MEILLILAGFSSHALSPAPQTVYVGNGTWGSPYYYFYSDSNGNNPINLAEYVFYHGTQYTFTKISGTMHPFFISDIIKDLNLINVNDFENIKISDVKDLISAKDDEITFFHNKNYLRYCRI